MSNLSEAIKELSPLELSKLIRGRNLTFLYLERIGFSPYFPYGTTNFSSPTFNDFSRIGLNDIHFFTEKYGDEIRKSGVLTVSITGSASVGLANAFPFGCIKERKPDGFILTRTEGGGSDIDVELLVSANKLMQAIEIVKTLFQKSRRGGEFQSPINSFSFGFYPIEDVCFSLNDEYSSALVRFGAWTISRQVFMGLDTINEIKELAQQLCLSTEKVANFFWNNLADRYLFHQYRLMIKRGNKQSLFIPSSLLPTLFDPKIRLRKMSYSRILINPDDRR